MKSLTRQDADNQYLIGFGCVLLATIGLSFKAIFIKQVYLLDPEIDAISMLAIRLVLALPFFALLLYYSHRKQLSQARLPLRYLPHCLILGALGYYLSALLDFSALAHIPVNLSRILLFLYPTFVVIICLLLQPGSIQRHVIYALLLTYAGLVLVCIELLPSATPAVLMGCALALGAAVAFALYTYNSATMIARLGAMRFTCYAVFASAAVTLAHALSLHGTSLFMRQTEVYLHILPMAVFSTALPLLLMAEGIKRMGAANSSIISTCGPVITAISAYLIFGEQLTTVQAIGGLMIMAGVFLVARNKAKQTRVQQ